MNQLAIWWNINDSHPYAPGSVGHGLPETGWPGFVRDKVRPAIEWCEASGVEPIVEIHHPFGRWREQMHLDALDFATVSSAHYLWMNFISAWRPITAKYRTVCYVGSIGVHPGLASLSPSEQWEMIRRNLQPILDAGFQQIVVDHSSSAISIGFDVKDAAGKVIESVPRSPDQLLMLTVDELLLRRDGLQAKRAGVEAAPRSFQPWRELVTRDCWLLDRTYHVRHGSKHGPAEVERGWGPLKYIKGRVHRIVRPGDGDVPTNLAAVKAIAADKHTPVLSAKQFMDAGIKASEVFAK